ncbi:MAG TPA: thioredoxin [Mycobacterium sp.]|jgi:thioredoxin 2
MKSTTVVCPNCGKRNRVPAAADGKPRCANCHRWLPWVVDAGDLDFAEIVEKSAVPVVVDLWATWCGPCRMVSPALEQLARERAGNLKLVKVDVDSAPTISQRFSVRAVPTLLLIDHGQLLARRSGAAPVAALRDWVDQAMLTTTKEEHS